MHALLTILLLVSVDPLFSISAPAAEPEYDIVVYGGTSGGVSAAVQAVRMGRSVILMEPGKHLGGMSSGGLGATDIGNKRAIGGISREFYQRVRTYYENDANWKYEKRAEFRGTGHAPKEDTVDPHGTGVHGARPVGGHGGSACRHGRRRRPKSQLREIAGAAAAR
jgi:choline dehydrogenase-like flavoprotein